MIYSALVGVDIGSEYLRASILRPGKPIEILLDSNSKRTFPTVMTVIPLTDEGIPPCINITEADDFKFVMNDPQLIRKYPNSTIHHWSNFLAKLSISPLKQLALRRKFYAPITSHFNNRALVSGIFPDLIFHRALPQINDSALRLDPNAVIKSSVFAVPQFWPQQERDSIRSIARSLKFNPYVVDSTRAVATYFALEHKQHISKTPTKVAFFDFGSSNIQISLMEFVRRNKIIKINQLAYDYDDEIGGRDIDILIFDLLMNQYGRPLTVKSEQLLLEESKKIKHRLTTDKAVAGRIEELDFIYKITLEEFETAMKPILELIQRMIKNLINQTKADRVQMIGGCSRIPIVQNVVREAFEVERLMFSLNLEDAVAIGSGYVGASQNSDYMLPKIEYKPLKLWNVSIKYHSSSCRFNGTIPAPGTIHWLYLDLGNGRPFPTGSSIYLAWSSTNETTNITMTKDGLYRFKNGTQHRSKGWKTRVLDFAKHIKEREEAQTKLDETVNNMENLLLDTKMELLEGKFDEFATENERKALSYAINVTDRWFLKQRHFEKDTITYRYELLRNAIGSVMCRKENAELLPKAIENMTNLIEDINDTIKSNWMFKKKDKRPSRAAIRHLLQNVIELQLWFDERYELQKQLKPIENPVLFWRDIDDKLFKLQALFEDMKDRAMGRTSENKNENVYVYPPQSSNVNVKYK